ncbi:putative phage abortive infection protein [Labilibaculum euxinus]
MNVKVISILAIVLVAIWLGLYSWKCRNRIKNYKWVFEWFYPCIVFLISISVLYLLVNRFIEATAGEFTWHMKTEAWSYFGAFIGAILLAATLIYQIRASRRQQVESKFFELVKYYRDNISEMRIRNPFYYKDDKGRVYEEKFVEGRRVMKIIFDQYKVAFGICKQYKIVPEYKFEKLLNRKPHYKNHFIPKSPKKSKPICEQQKRRLIENEIAYLIMFWGVSRGSSDELNERLTSQFDLIDNGNTGGFDIIDYIKKIPAVYECGDSSRNFSVIINSFLKTKILSNSTIINNRNNGFVKFFGGHQYQLGHYYRHLFQAVKFIDKQPKWLFSKDEKYDYIKTLRAQMSNYEQALLFINSLTIMGRDWEYSNKDGKCLISEYNLIKNLPKKFIPNMQPQDYYPAVDFEWKSKKVKKSLIKLKFDNRVSV